MVLSEEELKAEYCNVLSAITREQDWGADDKYSGVFLPVMSSGYEKANPRVMLVGRETAGWNTDNNRNTMQRVIRANESNTTGCIVEEAIERYRKHLKRKPSGQFVTKDRSKFKQYYFEIAKELGQPADGLIYANLFAWDYNKKSPMLRPESEFSPVTQLSMQLLAIQIKAFKPQFIIFASGVNGIDRVIKDLFNNFLDGYKTVSVEPRKLWEFKSANYICFRIAHPRAQNGHAKYRKEVIDRIKNYVQNSVPG